MEREIKFRGRNYYGMWMYGYLMPAPKPTIHIDCDYSISVSPSALKSVDRMLYEVETNTIGQFTGMKDKNGKEIYEGDIVDVAVSSINYVSKDPTPYHRICVCVYQKEYASFIYERVGKNYKRKLSRNWKYKVMGSYDIQCVEVLGNIHDNPELLEQE